MHDVFAGVSGDTSWGFVLGDDSSRNRADLNLARRAERFFSPHPLGHLLGVCMTGIFSFVAEIFLAIYSSGNMSEQLPASFNREGLRDRLAVLAHQGIYLGTSSWKYTGWVGQLYDEQRYVYRGKFAESRFEKNCLAEYAETFKTVCVDAAYYQFPSQKYLHGLVSQVPEDFLFTFKVTDDITIKKFTNLPRFGAKAGKPNRDYLNADLFVGAFLKPLEPFRANVGCLIFEFSRFYPADYEHGRDFVADMDRFLGRLPLDWRYGVEIRNKQFLHPDYFSVLRKHGVAHCFNSWSGMPELNEQLAMDGSETSDDFVVSRMLLKPGRSYEEAVKQFSPYRDTQEINEPAREAGRMMLKKAKERAKKAFIYVNNRLEGSALKTIKALVQE